jgi:hypothetical protein
MANTKTFSTAFKIGATWTGGPAVAKAQTSLGTLAKHAHRANTQIRGMARSVFLGVGAYNVLAKAISGTTQLMEKSFAAATEAQKTHDALGLSIERKRQKIQKRFGQERRRNNRDNQGKHGSPNRGQRANGKRGMMRKRCKPAGPS